MDQIKIGKFIAEKRKERGLTQSELAERLSVTDRAVSKWENGRNMPDSSLFKPLCDILEISVNDLISGEEVTFDDYKEKCEENIISTIDYTNRKISEKNNIIAAIFLIFGLLLAMAAMTIFPSESSSGSEFSVIGVMISLIGFFKFTKKLRYVKRLLLSFSYFILFVSVLFLLDYVGVVNAKQAPRFSTYKITAETSIYYDTLFYDVVRCQKDTKKEYYKVLKNQSYDADNIEQYCKK